MTISKIGKLVSEKILNGKEDYFFDLNYNIKDEDLNKYVYSAAINSNGDIYAGRFITTEQILCKYVINSLAKSIEYSLITFKPIKLELSLKIDNVSVIDIVEESI